MLLSDIQSIDVINVITGNKIGRIKDIDIDSEKGNVLALVILASSKLRSFFSGEELIIIPWENVIKFGNDVVIVNHEEQTII